MKRNPWGACLEIDNGTALQAACIAHVKSSINQNQVDWTFSRLLLGDVCMF
jgi:hypothetical protein